MPALLVESAPGTATFILNRPERRNALNLEMLELLCQELERAVNDPAIRVIFLRGAGSDFSSGFDLIEGGQLDTSLKHGELLVRAQLLLAEAPAICIAIASGFALAGGGALIAACDYAVATDDAKFGYPVLKVGIVPTPGMPFLRHEMCERDFRELVLGGEIKSGSWAADAGLVNRALPTLEEAVAEAERFAEMILAASPAAVRETKRFSNRLVRETLRQEMAEALVAYTEIRRGAEAQEGLRAFAEKRLPVWG